MSNKIYKRLVMICVFSTLLLGTNTSSATTSEYTSFNITPAILYRCDGNSNIVAPSLHRSSLSENTCAQEIITAFSQIIRDYQRGDIRALSSKLTLRALENLHNAPSESLHAAGLSDYAHRGGARIDDSYVSISSDNHYAWLQMAIAYSKGGSNQIIAFMVHDLSWKLATIELT